MKKIVINAITLYRNYISPIKGRTCRFYPSCSQYGIESIEKYGIWKGIFLTITRILRCHPFNPGGYDPVK